MQTIKLVVFDLDDTLFPEHQFVYSGFHAVSEWVLHHYGLFGFFDVAWALFQAGKRGTIFNQALEQLEFPSDPTLVDQLVQVYRQHAPKLRLHADADWAIEFFGGNRTTGLITNGFLKTQRNKVRALGIEPRIHEILYCDSLGAAHWKPSPAPYRRMMEITGFQGNECVYVGDHAIKDFIGAKQLGWMTVRICRPDGEHTRVNGDIDQDAQYKIKSLYELENML